MTQTDVIILKYDSVLSSAGLRYRRDNLVLKISVLSAVREQIIYAKCLAGMAFSNVLLGIVHSMTYKAGALFSAVHIRTGVLRLFCCMQLNIMQRTSAAKSYVDITIRMRLEGAS